MEPAHLSPATVAVTAGRPHPLPNAPLNTPVTFASTYAARALSAEPNDVGYGRWGNPTWTAFEEGLGALERGEALAFASGMAAVDAAFALVPPGGAVVIPGSVYNGTEALAPDLAATGRIQLRRPAGIELDDVLPALDGAAMLWLESPSNPLLQVADLPALIAAGHAAGALVVVDNTFATPLLQRPLALGADIVMHSTTKYFGGHSDVLGGALVFAHDDAFAQKVAHRLHVTGAVLAPFSAWLILRGCRSLGARMAMHCANARKVADFLAAHPAIERVNWPGLASHPGHAVAARQMRDFGGMLSIQLRGGRAAALAMASKLQVFTNATSLGGCESLIEHRASVEGANPRSPQDLLRISVGLEDADDLVADLAQALG